MRLRDAGEVAVTMPARSNLADRWVTVAGAIIGTVTLLFFMGLVLLAIADRPVPCGSQEIVNITLSLGTALAATFIGGNVAARGMLPIPALKNNPLVFSLGGGIATLLLMLALTANLFPKSNCNQTLALNCPAGFQQHSVVTAGFAFCYPSSGWEIRSTIPTRESADVYLERSQDKKSGLHFHVSPVAMDMVGRPDVIVERSINAWKIVDSSLQVSAYFLNGRQVSLVSLKIKDADGAVRSTDIIITFIDAGRLLEIFMTEAPNITPENREMLRQIRSTVSFI